MKKPCAEDSSSSPFNRLPDELVLQIFNKIIDFKTLCTCKLVSKRFPSIVLQIDSVSVTVSSEFELFDVMDSIRRFTRLKSLHTHLPFLNSNTGNSNFKWKIQVSDRVDSFVFVSPNSIHTSTLLNGVNESSLQNEEEENVHIGVEKYIFALHCCRDAVCWLMLLAWAYDCRLLEYVSVTDSCKRGTVCFNSREKISQVRGSIFSEDFKLKPGLLKNPHRVSESYVPLLRLPVSGYVMKGVTMISVVRDDLPDDSVVNVDVDKEDDDFEQDKEEAAYREAVIEIFKKHRGSIKRLS